MLRMRTSWRSGYGAGRPYATVVIRDDDVSNVGEVVSDGAVRTPTTPEGSRRLVLGDVEAARRLTHRFVSSERADSLTSRLRGGGGNTSYDSFRTVPRWTSWTSVARPNSGARAR